MTTNEITESILTYYEYFIQSIGYKKYVQKSLSINEEKTVNNFIKALQKRYDLPSIGPNFLFRYFTFGFQYYSTLEMRWGKWIMLSWIIGTKAFKRWEEKRENWLYWCEQFLQEKNIKFDEIAQRETNEIKINQWVEFEKSRYFNTDEGFSNCINQTTLYDSQSLSCMRCGFRTKCKHLLQLNYPLLSRRRNEATI